MCVLVSFISVSCNTPQTFKQVEELKYITLAFDFVTGSILAIEASSNIINHVQVNCAKMCCFFLFYVSNNLKQWFSNFFCWEHLLKPINNHSTIANLYRSLSSTL